MFTLVFLCALISVGWCTTVVPPCPPIEFVSSFVGQADVSGMDPSDLWITSGASCFSAALMNESQLSLSPTEQMEYLTGLISVASLVQAPFGRTDSRMVEVGKICENFSSLLKDNIKRHHRLKWEERFDHFFPAGPTYRREHSIRYLSMLVTPWYNLDFVCRSLVLDDVELLRIVMMQKYFRKEVIVGSEVRMRSVHFHNILVDRNENLLSLAIDQLVKNSFPIGWNNGSIGGLRVRFKHEAGIDTGGLFSEFVTLVFRALVDSEIFVPTEDGTDVYTVGTKRSDDFANHYRLAGILMGLCFLQEAFVPYKLSLGLFKDLKDKSGVNFEDEFKSEFPVLWRNLHYHDDSVTFVATDHDGKDVELIPNGKSVLVTVERLPQYQAEMARWIMMRSKWDQFGLIRQGFELIVGEKFFFFVTVNHLQQMICKTRRIRVDDLQGKLEITWPNGMGHDDREMWNRRFRDYIIKLDKESRLEEFIQFVTGLATIDSRHISLALYPFEDADNRYPFASTCMRRLIVPIYSSEEIFVEKMTGAMNDPGSREFGSC